MFKNETEMLEQNNQEVLTYTVSNEEIKSSIKGKVKVGVNSIWSYSEYKDFLILLKTKQPDIVHVHNFFPLISPSIYYACSKLNIPIVQTLHNYRLICPAATFLRDNEICEKCLDGSLINSVKHGCYRNSVLQTVPVAAMIGINNLLNTWNSKVDKYIALTDFAKMKFVQSGIPESKIAVKPNFVKTALEDNKKIVRENYVLFVGRISGEKGIDMLLEAWSQYQNPSNTKLLIIGDGPEKLRLENQYKYNEKIIFKGKLPSSETMDYMKRAKYLVVPSICYEGFPMTIIEAFSEGIPVIASDIGSMKEIIKPGKTGFHFSKGSIESLISVLVMALSYEKYASLAVNARLDYVENYTDVANYEQLMKIYESVIEEKRAM